jgi:hypothetical protein
MRDDAKRRFLVVTAGNLRQNHIYVRGHLDFFPPECVGPSRKTQNGARSLIRIALEGLAEVVSTDLSADPRTGKLRGFFRGRGWVRKFFQYHNVVAGDLLALQRTDTTSYRLSVESRTSVKSSGKTKHADRLAAPPAISADNSPQIAEPLFSTRFSGPAWPDRFGEWISEWSKRGLNAPIRTLSLFTGAGGLDIELVNDYRPSYKRRPKPTSRHLTGVVPARRMAQ